MNGKANQKYTQELDLPSRGFGGTRIPGLPNASACCIEYHDPKQSMAAG